MIRITREVARKVRDTVDAGLVRGLGMAEPGKMCVEAAVCYALGLRHSDDPGCVSSGLREFKIQLNDAHWSSTGARASGLRRLAIAQLGTAHLLDGAEFERRVIEMTIRRSIPMAMRSAVKVTPKYAEKLEAAASYCEKEGTIDAAELSAAATDAIGPIMAYDRTDYTAVYASRAAYYASIAQSSISNAATAGIYAAVAVSGLYESIRCDHWLAQYAEWVVEILIDMKAPGCEFLDLVPIEQAASAL